MAKKRTTTKATSDSTREADRAEFMELIRLPGTPESRQADHERVQATVAENIRQVRSAIEKLLGSIRQRFRLPLSKGSDSQRTAALSVLHQAEHLESTLLKLPRSEWRQGKFHECPPTYCGAIVQPEHRDDYIQAMEFLRPLATKLVHAARQIDQPLLTIHPKWISGLKKSSRRLAFVEPVTRKNTVEPPDER